MNPFLDQFAVAALIGGALAFFVVRFLRKRAGGKSCGGDCGCGTTKPGKPGRS
ncbi:MAG: FeoB-associated Cys-rich membrane protein [Chthoniobacter sp.]|nr:FeoB-associated Cys-rich membrane protein [Chthoniobacter sp.]